MFKIQLAGVFHNSMGRSIIGSSGVVAMLSAVVMLSVLMVFLVDILGLFVCFVCLLGNLF